MPIYAYKCDECGHEFERLAKVGEAPAMIACPACGDAAFRVPTAPAIHFKGSGWTEPTRKAASGASTDSPADLLEESS